MLGHRSPLRVASRVLRRPDHPGLAEPCADLGTTPADQVGPGADRVGSGPFTRTSAVVRQVVNVRHPLRSLCALRHAPAVVRYLSSLARLDISPLPLTDSFREHFFTLKAGLPRNRWGQAVLLLGPTQDHYLRGRSRQAVRTNVRHARQLGFRVVALQKLQDQRRVQAKLTPHVAGMHQWAHGMFDRPSDLWFAVLDHTGCPAGVALVSPAGDVALLKVLVVASSFPGHHFARHLLHTEMVAGLRDHGTRCLIAYGAHPLRQPWSISYFQHLLGYQLFNLRLAPHART